MQRRYRFQVGDRIQVIATRYTKLTTEHLYGTIKRIELRPDPAGFVDPEDWYRGPHWVLFWTEIEHPDIQGVEIPFRYRNLQPAKPPLVLASTYKG